MVDGGGDARLFFELGDVVVVRAQFLAQELEGDHPVEVAVQRLVDRPHAAGAQGCSTMEKWLNCRSGAHRRAADRAMELGQGFLVADIHQCGAIRTSLKACVAGRLVAYDAIVTPNNGGSIPSGPGPRSGPRDVLNPRIELRTHGGRRGIPPWKWGSCVHGANGVESIPSRVRDR